MTTSLIAEFEAHGTEEDQLCMRYVLDGEAGARRRPEAIKLGPQPADVGDDEDDGDDRDDRGAPVDYTAPVNFKSAGGTGGGGAGLGAGKEPEDMFAADDEGQVDPKSENGKLVPG
mgnify:CR=1 FL=1